MSDRRGHNIAPARLSAALALSGQTRTGWTTVDFGFGTELLRALDVTAGGEVVLAGKWGNYSIVARLLADGTLDTSFHEDGKLTLSGGVYVEINDLLVEPDGRIVLGGLSIPGPGINFCLMIGRLNADGTTDTSFGVSGWRQVDTDATEWADERVLALARQADGKIIAAGYTQAGELTLARLSGLTRHYAMQDANWNLTGIVDPATGQAVERYVFTPYGGRTVLDSAFESRSTSSFGWIVGHQGLAVDVETGLVYNRARYLDTSMGRFTIRDPLGYVDGMTVYQCAMGNPYSYVDSSGLWGSDIHQDLTTTLATWAGLGCPGDIGTGANAPDVDFWRAPGYEGVATMAAGYVLDIAIWKTTHGLVWPGLGRRKRQAIADWHFPADWDGVVRKGSDAAREKARIALQKCDLKGFSEALHVFQDSWSHQGKPFVGGVGHSRGVEQDPTTGQWVILPPYKAVVGSTTDDAKLWNADIRELALETYQLLVEFGKQCGQECVCSDGKTLTAKDWKPRSVDEIKAELKKRYPGENVVEWKP